ncbi:MAG: YbaN family protein [Paracoccaceae bacterium]
MRWLWGLLGLIALALGAAGVFLPLLPTVPFLLLAAFFFARSSERLHDWLLRHPVFGPPIEHWRRSGAIGRRAKRLATVSVLAAFGISVALGLPVWVLVVQALVLTAVAVFIWTRPTA